VPDADERFNEACPLTAAQIEHMLAQARIRDLKVTFEVENPDGTAIPFEVTLPAGELRMDSGRLLEGGFYDKDVSPIHYGRVVVRLALLPDMSLDPARQLVIRVARQ
jgi:hypothetical protein